MLRVNVKSVEILKIGARWRLRVNSEEVGNPANSIAWKEASPGVFLVDFAYNTAINTVELQIHAFTKLY